MKTLYHYRPMMILTILATIVMVLTQALIYCNTMVFNTDFYLWAISESGADSALYNEMDAYFARLSAPTGIPKDVYTKSLNKKNVSVAAKKLTKMSLDYTFGKSNAKPVVNYDYTQFETDVTEYIETYSEANDIPKDAEYYTYIDNTLNVAEKKMDANFDIMKAKKLSEGTVPSTARRIVPSVSILLGVAVIVLAGIIGLMLFVDRHHPFYMPYWLGVIMFCGSTLLLIPTIYLRTTGYFDGLFMEDESVYYAITGALYNFTDRVILVNGILFALGIILIIFAQIIHIFRVKDAKMLSDENDD